jgi:hypothetical protein
MGSDGKQALLYPRDDNPLQDAPRFVLDGDTTYVTGDEGLLRVIGDAAPVVVTPNLHGVHELVVDGDRLIAWTQDGVTRVPKAGGEPVSMIDSQLVLGFAVEDGTIYLINGADVVSLDARGRTRTLATDIDGPTSIAVVHGAVFVTTLDGLIRLGPGGAPEVFLDGPVDPDVRRDGDSVLVTAEERIWRFSADWSPPGQLSRERLKAEAIIAGRARTLDCPPGATGQTGDVDGPAVFCAGADGVKRGPIVGVDGEAVRLTGQYANGKRDGRWVETTGDGRVETDYVADVVEGHRVTYDKDGHERSDYAFHAGEREGPFRELDETGAEVRRGTMGSGQPFQVEELWPNGKVRRTTVYDDAGPKTHTDGIAQLGHPYDAGLPALSADGKRLALPYRRQEQRYCGLMVSVRFVDVGSASGTPRDVGLDCFGKPIPAGNEGAEVDRLLEEGGFRTIALGEPVAVKDGAASFDRDGVTWLVATDAKGFHVRASNGTSADLPPGGELEGIDEIPGYVELIWRTNGMLQNDWIPLTRGASPPPSRGR